MSPPTKDLFQFVLEGKIRHGKHPVLDWNMRNVVVERDAADNIKPSKKKSTEKIDGVVALLMGLARAMLEEADSGSVYDRRGVLFI
jgi:phage terminase large subunit-like protein